MTWYVFMSYDKGVPQGLEIFSDDNPTECNGQTYKGPYFTIPASKYGDMMEHMEAIEHAFNQILRIATVCTAKPRNW